MQPKSLNFLNYIDQVLSELEQPTTFSNQLGLIKLQPKFEDSSCELWQFNCHAMEGENADKKNVFEKCFIKFQRDKTDSILNMSSANSTPTSALKDAYSNEAETPFWIMMESLFGVTLQQNFKNAPTIYAQLATQNMLKVPQLKACVEHRKTLAIVVSELKGKSFDENQLSLENIAVFAQFLAQLHSQSFKQFGGIDKSKTLLNSNKTVEFNKPQTVVEVYTKPVSENQIQRWQEHLMASIDELSYSETPLIDKTLIKKIAIARIVPVMMDLRWDQFAADNGNLTGVFDLDAYVAAPIELDFVILEYLMNHEQLAHFVKIYQANTSMALPTINKVRAVYRHLFFLVNALGESDYQKWMARPSFFA